MLGVEEALEEFHGTGELVLFRRGQPRLQGAKQPVPTSRSRRADPFAEVTGKRDDGLAPVGGVVRARHIPGCLQGRDDRAH